MRHSPTSCAKDSFLCRQANWSLFPEERRAGRMFAMLFNPRELASQMPFQCVLLELLVRFSRDTWEIASLVLCYRRPSRVVSGFSFWANTFSLGDLRLNRLDVVSFLFCHSHASISSGIQKYHVWQPPFSNYENLGLTDRCMFVDFVRSTPSSVVMPRRSWGTTSWQRTRRASPSSGCHILAHNVDIVECGMIPNRRETNLAFLYRSFPLNQCLEMKITFLQVSLRFG